jgi:hypothetical protein
VPEPAPRQQIPEHLVIDVGPIYPPPEAYSSCYYVITVLGHHPDGFGLLGERTFSVNA